MSETKRKRYVAEFKAKVAGIRISMDAKTPDEVHWWALKSSDAGPSLKLVA